MARGKANGRSRGTGSRRAATVSGASRAFVGALALGAVLTWGLGNPDVVWRDIASFVPGHDAGGIPAMGAALPARVDAARIPPRLLDTRGGPVYQRLEVPMPTGPDARGVHVEAHATIEALNGSITSLRRQSAKVQLVFKSGRHTLRVAPVAALTVAGRRVSRGTRVEVPRGTDRIELTLVARAGTGTHRVALMPVRFTQRGDPYLLAAGILAAAWAVLASLMVRASARTGAGPGRYGAVAALAVIVVGTGASASLPVGGLLAALQSVPRALAGGNAHAAGAVWEFGHFLTFAAAAFFLGTLRRRLRTGRAALVTGLLALAAATEALQRHLPDRTASLADLGADVAGMAAGLCCVAVWHRTRWGRRHRERASTDRRGAERRSGARSGGERRAATSTRSGEAFEPCGRAAHRPDRGARHGSPGTHGVPQATGPEGSRRR